MNDEVRLEINGIRFAWDKDKAAANWRKHGITFEAAVWAFFDPNSVDVRDLAHEDDEPRRNIIAMTPGIVSTIFVVYVERIDIDDKEIIRIISARKADKREVRLYERSLSR